MSKVTTGIGREGFVNGLFWRKLQFPRDRVDGGAEAPRPASRGVHHHRKGRDGREKGKPLAAAWFPPESPAGPSRIEIFWKHNLVVETSRSKGEVQAKGILTAVGCLRYGNPPLEAITEHIIHGDFLNGLPLKVWKIRCILIQNVTPTVCFDFNLIFLNDFFSMEAIY